MNLLYQTPFKSFWMGGFECTDQLNSSGDRVDFLNITHHLSRLDEDYRQLAAFGIETVREGIRWSFVEKQPYQYDFTIVQKLLSAGQRHGVQQLWDICHFGFPADLSPLHPHFTKRFIALCCAFVEFYKQECPNVQLIVTPVNEVSFISWLGGEVGGTAPYAISNGWNIKYALMRSYIQSIKAMKAIYPGLLIMTTEPIVNIVPPLFADENDIEQAKRAHLEQYQAIDILVGKICPELGGSPDLVDILGFNYYYNNQWVVGFNEFLPWLNEEPDVRWRPLSALLRDAYHRYGKPIVLTETSHPGEDRPKWIKFIAEQCKHLLANAIPFWGVCIYPIIDRPDWDNISQWHQSGLWDEVFNLDGSSERALNMAYAQALLKAQQELLQDSNTQSVEGCPSYSLSVGANL